MGEAGHFLVLAAQQGFQLHLALLPAPLLQGNTAAWQSDD